MRFATGYMDEVLRDLRYEVEVAQERLAGVEFDTLVGTGMSGAVLIPALAMTMNKAFALVRKEMDDSHHGGGRLLGELRERWIFVDDFVGTGRTRQRVMEKVAYAIQQERAWFPESIKPIYPQYVGDYLYGQYTEDGMIRSRFIPVGDRITVKEELW